MRQRPLRPPGSVMMKESLLPHLLASCEASVPGACYQVSSSWRCWLHRQQERDSFAVTVVGPALWRKFNSLDSTAGCRLGPLLHGSELDRAGTLRTAGRNLDVLRVISTLLSNMSSHRLRMRIPNVARQATKEILSDERKAAKLEAERRQLEIKTILTKFDKDRSGGLNWSELSVFLKDLAVTHGHPNYETTDEDIKWMISKATRKNPTRAASSESAGAKIRNWAVWRSEDRQLEKDDLAAGLPEFMCYLSQKHMIDEVFADFNSEYEDGHLDREQIKAVLTKLGGSPPREDVLDEVASLFCLILQPVQCGPRGAVSFMPTDSSTLTLQSPHTGHAGGR